MILRFFRRRFREALKLVVLIAALHSLAGNADQSLSNTHFVLVCPNNLIYQIPLNTQSSNELDSALVQAYLGLIEDSERILTLKSLKKAGEHGDPFCVEGRGHLWPETKLALERIQAIIDAQDDSRRLRLLLVAALRQKMKESEKKASRVRRKTRTRGKEAPLSRLTRLTPDPNFAMSIKVSPDGKSLVSVGQVGDVFIYDLSKGAPKLKKKTKSLSVHSNWLFGSRQIGTQGVFTDYSLWPIYPITFTRDSSSFFMSVTARSPVETPVFVKVNTSTGRIDAGFEDAQRFVKGVPSTERATKILLSPDEDTVVLNGPQDIVWRLDTNQLPITMKSPGAFRSGVFSDDGQFYFSTNSAGGLRAYSIEDGAELLEPIGKLPKDYPLDRDWENGGFKEPEYSGSFKRRPYFILERGAHFVVQHPQKPHSLLGLYASSRRNSNKKLFDSGMLLAEFDYSRLENSLTGDGFFDDHDRHSNVHYVKKGAIQRNTLVEFSPPKAPVLNLRTYYLAGGLLASPSGKYVVAHTYVSPESGDHYSDIGDKLGPFFVDVFQTGRWSRPHRRLGRFHGGIVKKMEFTHDERYLITLTTEGTLRVFEVGSRGEFQFVGELGKNKEVTDHPILDFSVGPDLSRIYLIQRAKAYYAPFFGNGEEG